MGQGSYGDWAYAGFADLDGGDTLVAQVGEIGVSREWVYVPQGRFAVRGTTWTMTDQVVESTTIPAYAIVLAVIFFVACLLGLLFLLVKERTVQGVVQVSVEGDGFYHATQVPVSSWAAITDTHRRVEYARSLAAAP
jgi:hypothetical protein